MNSFTKKRSMISKFSCLFYSNWNCHWYYEIFAIFKLLLLFFFDFYNENSLFCWRKSSKFFLSFFFKRSLTWESAKTLKPYSHYKHICMGKIFFIFFCTSLRMWNLSIFIWYFNLHTIFFRSMIEGVFFFKKGVVYIAVPLCSYIYYILQMYSVWGAE